MQRLAANDPSAVTVAVIQDLSRRPITCLSDQEEKIIAAAEALRKLEVLESQTVPEIHPDNIAERLEHRHRNWIVGLVNGNLDRLKVNDLRYITEAIAKFRPDDVVAIVSEFISERKLARDILGSINVLYSDLIAEIKNDNWTAQYN